MEKNLLVPIIPGQSNRLRQNPRSLRPAGDHESELLRCHPRTQLSLPIVALRTTENFQINPPIHKSMDADHNKNNRKVLYLLIFACLDHVEN